MKITYHDEHLLDRAAMTAMRAVLAVQPRMKLEPASRPTYDELIEKTPVAEGVEFEAEIIGGVSGWWCRPVNAPDGRAIVYLHGGGYVMGTAAAYRNFSSQIISRTDPQNPGVCDPALGSPR